MDVAIGLWTGFIGVAWMYTYCYYGERTSASLERIGDATVLTNWYCYPHQLRKYVILIMRQSQELFYFDGLKIVYCNLITFAAVSSIIMAIRQVAKAFLTLSFSYVNFRLCVQFVRIT